MTSRVARWGRMPTGAGWTGHNLKFIEVPNTPEFIRAVSGALSYLTDESYWEEGTAASDHAEAALLMLEGFLMSDMIGTIFPYVTAAPPSNMLACDGSTYTQAQYPRLYDRIDPAYKVGATFTVPDLGGRVLIGASATYPAATTGGSETHSLTEAEMPAHTHTSPPHSHTTAPHSHTETGAVPAIINGGLEAPASAAVPSPTVTGVASVTVNAASASIDSTGGGGAHNNMQPYHTVKYGIVAR